MVPGRHKTQGDASKGRGYSSEARADAGDLIGPVSEDYGSRVRQARTCEKSNESKFSHNLYVEREVEKGTRMMMRESKIYPVRHCRNSHLRATHQ